MTPWSDLLILGVLVAILLWYFRSLFFDDCIYGELDIRRSLFLFRSIAYETMRSGELPLWIKHIQCGMPLLGGALVTPFYPPDLVFMSLGIPLHVVYNLDLLLHLVAGQVFSYLFFKHVLKNRAAALLSSMWFWNAFFLGSMIIGDALNIRAMLLVPAVFYFVETGVGENGRVSHLWLGTLALSFQLLSGGLQFVLYTMIATGLYAVFLLSMRARRHENVRVPALGFAAFVVIGLAISSIQLAPAWEYSRLSVRATDIPWFRVWALEPHLLLEYVIPMIDLGSSKRGYFGVVPLVMAGYSTVFWKDKRKYFFMGLALLSILYSLGGYTRISSFLAGLPLVREFRGPARAALFFNLSVFVLAGGGIVGLMQRREQSRRDKVAFAVITIILLIGLIAAAFLSRSYSNRAAWGGMVSGGFCILSVTMASLLLMSSRFKTLAGFALAVVLFGNLAVVYKDYYSPTPVSDIFGRDWTVDYLEDRVDLFRVAAYNTAHTNYLALFGVEVANGHHPFPTLRAAAFAPLLTEPKIASLAGIKYNVLYRFKDNGQPYNPPVQDQEQVIIQPAPLEPLPRAFLVGRYRVFPASRAASVLMLSDFDPRREVVLEKTPEGFELHADAEVSGSATVTVRTANEIRVETACEQPAILVLGESYYPGWRAEVDGRKTEVLAANLAFRAVALRPGTHTVVFRFRPGSFVVGAVLSCVGVTLWVTWGVLLRRNASPAVQPEIR
ncbi:MAG: hypothetical protein Kow0099_32360 [Candidatus Abyssubacteria bacterium]